MESVTESLAVLEGRINGVLADLAAVIAQRNRLLEICRQIEREGEGRVQIALDLRVELRAAIVAVEAAAS